MGEPGKRVAVLGQQFEETSYTHNVRDASLDDVVIIDAIRTPMTRARRGGLKDTPADDLLATLLKSIIQRTGVEAAAIGDVVIGSVLGPSSQRANECRIAMFLAGFPEEVPVRTVNRQCSSGLQAVADVAASIKSGYYSIGLAGGVETMSQNPMTWEGGINPAVETNPKAQSCLIPMGNTSDNVAKKFGIDRASQDQFAALSHKKAALAQAEGRFTEEIIPVETKYTDPKTKQTSQIVVSADDGIRAGTSAQSLSKLKTVFSADGTTTAGNSSQITDGASLVLLASRREALRRGLPILGVFRSFAVAGVDPALMGIGPAVAIPKAVAAAGIQLGDVDVYEINEAFASQASYCIHHLGIPEDRVNPNGGAIALGHPLGNTGSRMTGTLLYEMRRRGPRCRFGVVSMCIGSGMGAAAVFERDGSDVATHNARAITYQSHLSRSARP